MTYLGRKTGIKKLRAEDYARSYLGKIFRQSGESYYEHSKELVDIFLGVSDDTQLADVLWLHDLLVHKNGEKLLSTAPLTSDQKRLVRGMYDLRKLHVDRRTKDLDMLIETAFPRPELLLMRLVHRLNDMRNLHCFSDKNQQMIARETLYIYTTFAEKLSLNLWRHEMEDIAFKLLHPKVYGKLEAKFETYENIDQQILKKTVKHLKDLAKQKGKQIQVFSRTKSKYSTYRKMMAKDKGFETMCDRIAVRVIVPSVIDCYEMMGLIHQRFNPLPGKIKDFIGLPKPNGYQSLHTTIYPLPGVEKLPVEIQIRTSDMHELNEYGVAAHYRYKDYQYALSSHISRGKLYKNLELLKEDVGQIDQLNAVIKNVYERPENIVFDAEGVVYNIPKKATVLDFVGQVYGKKIHKLKTAKLNGRKVKLDHPVRQGDIVDISFTNKKVSCPEWKDWAVIFEVRNMF